MSGSGSGCSTVVCPPLVKHDVFLSFRGEDTRHSFISHLYAELLRKNIHTFIDYKLGKGQEISPALHQAIQESLLYVIVFSQDYASSTWCLDELAHMLECRKRHGRHMIPVFYEVDPSTVRYQRGRYSEAFENHEKRFKEKVHAWKAALTQAAGLSGWDSQVTRPEETLIAEIVKDILKKLNPSSIDHQGIIGIEGHLSRIQSLLHVESPAPRIIGIWGMGGIGKTTIANQIYHKFAVQFGSSSVILNTEEEIGRHGMQQIRCKYISDILEEDIKPSGLSFAYEGLKRAKVLLILDDVNNSGQLKDLIGGHSRFGPGSRIILTSRDLQVLKNAGADEIYGVKELNPEDSLKLFCLHAFKQIHPKETYRALSEKILNYVNGIPLALEVLGSLLYDRTEEEWESELQKLGKLPNPEILNILKLSYDRLDDEQKDIFLDIACFYRGQWENVVEQTLNIFGFSAKIGINVLKERCLIYFGR